jgi:ABC-type branched-subunit amino acid transport system substrate-binding protein
MGVRTFALAYPDKEAAASVAARFWDEAQGAGGAVVAAESYPADATDFRDTARKLKGALYKAKPPAEADRVLPFLPGRRKPQLEPEVHLVRPGFEFQAVFVPDSYRRAAMLAPGFVFEEINLGGHIRDADNPPVVLLGGSALNHPDLVARGGAYVEGTVLVDGFFAGSQSQSVRRFVDAYRAAHGTDPSILEATAYDATLALIQAMHEGAVSRRDIARALRRIAPKESVTGLRGFGADGQAEHDLLVLQVKDKKIVQVWPAPPPVEPAP